MQQGTSPDVDGLSEQEDGPVLATLDKPRKRAERRRKTCGKHARRKMVAIVAAKTLVHLKRHRRRSGKETIGIEACAQWARAQRLGKRAGLHHADENGSPD